MPELRGPATPEPFRVALTDADDRVRRDHWMAPRPGIVPRVAEERPIEFAQDHGEIVDVPHVTRLDIHLKTNAAFAELRVVARRFIGAVDRRDETRHSLKPRNVEKVVPLRRGNMPVRSD